MFREAFLKEKRPKRPRRGVEPVAFPWLAVVVWIFFLGVAVYTVIFSEFHRVERITLSGLREIPSDRVDGYVREALFQRRFRVLSRGNLFVLGSRQLEEDILRRFPKFSAVEVRRLFPNAIDVTVSERYRILLFCSGDSCYLSDTDGNAIDPAFAYLSENEPFIIRLEDESGRAVSLGEPLYPADFPDRVSRLERGIREEAGLALSATVRTPSRVAHELRFRTDAGWEILVSTDIDPGKTLASLRLVLERELTPQRRERLRYVDLRTENRAFYAFQDDERNHEDGTDGDSEDGSGNQDDGTRDTKSDEQEESH